MAEQFNVVSKAFESHRREYASVEAKKRNWSIPHHIEMWDIAFRAFKNNDDKVFEIIFIKLKNNWLILRPQPKDKIPKSENIFNILMKIDPKISGLRLRELNDTHLPGLVKTLEAVSKIKELNNSISIMAISKFLHFRNPRLFIIKDRAEIESFVLKHAWIQRGIEVHKKRINKLLGNINSQLLEYIALLFWASQLLIDNPSIVTEFGNMLQDGIQEAKENACFEISIEDLRLYEAAAVEWFLLGVMHLPPMGLKLQAVEE